MACVGPEKLRTSCGCGPHNSQEPFLDIGSHTVMRTDTAAYANTAPTGVNCDLKESLP